MWNLLHRPHLCAPIHPAADYITITGRWLLQRFPNRRTITLVRGSLSMLNNGRVTMTADQLTGAARNLAHGLGIPVYIRDGHIYQQGPGLAFLPSGGARLTAAGAPSVKAEEADEAE